MMPERVDEAAVVVGVDGSDRALEAVSWAARYATVSRSLLRIVYALPPSDAYLGDAVLVSDRAIHDEIRERGRGILEAARAGALRTARGIEITTVVTESAPAQSLITESFGARIVVLGGHRSNVLRDLALGSVSIDLSRRAHCPVMVHRSDDETGNDTAGPVVVGVDHSATSLRALTVAFGQARTFDCSLTVARFWQPSTIAISSGAGLIDGQQLAAAEMTALEASLSRFRDESHDTAVKVECHEGSPVTGLRKLSTNARLTVVGTRGRGPVRGALLGSVSQSLIQRAASSVVVVP